MAEQLVIESPAFDRIRKGDGHAIEDAIRLLWLVANNEASMRTQTVQQAQNQISPKVLSGAPTTQQDNYDARDGGYVLFTSATPFTLTGLRNGIDGRTFIIENLGTGTVTIAHESAGSDAANRFYLRSGASAALATGQAVFAWYVNQRWRIASWVIP
jgi:hypothetical protein